MTEDPRCCGSGTCIIDTEGRCWCGQRWDGERMCAADTGTQDTDNTHGAPDPLAQGRGNQR